MTFLATQSKLKSKKKGFFRKDMLVMARRRERREKGIERATCNNCVKELFVLLSDNSLFQIINRLTRQEKKYDS